MLGWNVYFSFVCLFLLWVPLLGWAGISSSLITKSLWNIKSELFTELLWLLLVNLLHLLPWKIKNSGIRASLWVIVWVMPMVGLTMRSRSRILEGHLGHLKHSPHDWPRTAGQWDDSPTITVYTCWYIDSHLWPQAQLGHMLYLFPYQSL